jgi:hypothetical protein
VTDDGKSSIFDDVPGTGLSRGAIAAIAIGVLAVVVFAVGGAFLLWTHRLQKKRAGKDSMLGGG